MSQRPRSSDTEAEGGRTKDRQGGPAAPRAACSVKLGLGLGELCEMVDFSLPKIGRKEAQEAQEAQEAETDFVTEATELGHRVGRRRTGVAHGTHGIHGRIFTGGNRGNGGRKVSREKAQETESECVTEATELGHRGGRRTGEGSARWAGRSAGGGSEGGRLTPPATPTSCPT